VFKQLILLGLLLSLVFISGCTQTPTGDAVKASAENQAAGAIEKEMEDAVSNITAEDVENLLLT
jgi:outer membrane lipoprotein-sorting protein